MADQRSRGREIAFRILSGVFAAGAFGGLFGVAIVIAWTDSEAGGIHRVHDMGFGALYGAILTVGFAVQTVHPERKISAFYQIVVVVLATFIAAVLALMIASLGDISARLQLA